MSNLYPLLFKTIFKDKIWGGQKIREVLNKDFSPLPNCGETWEISGVKGNESVVAQGSLSGKSLPELIETYQGELVGERVYKQFGNEFPLLIKFIDANDDLSIQVHPDNELAQDRHDSFGKTEMWYIIQADEGASLISGFKHDIDKETFVRHFENRTLYDILNREHAKAGDVFFLPAGRIHTIGKGLLIAEIQQTSDITYRVYDFDRTDAQGNTRELHVEQALDAMDYQAYDSYKTQYDAKENDAVELVSSPYFQTRRLQFTEATTRDYAGLDSFVIYICLEGALTIEYAAGTVPLRQGDAVLIPASITSVNLKPEGSFNVLETFVPQDA